LNNIEILTPTENFKINPPKRKANRTSAITYEQVDETVVGIKNEENPVISDIYRRAQENIYTPLGRHFL
jgi:hypothetical protein